MTLHVVINLLDEKVKCRTDSADLCGAQFESPVFSTHLVVHGKVQQKLMQYT